MSAPTSDEIRAVAEMVSEMASRTPLMEQGELGTVLFKAAAALYEAAQIVEHPGMDQMRCLITDTGVHACGDNAYELLCGGPVDIMSSVVNTFGYPDCPDCLAILKGK